MAATHRAAFPQAGWPAQTFADYLENGSAAIFGHDTCFAVLRLMPPEAEILTFATHPDAQGQGRATQLLKEMLSDLARARCDTVFLDVAEDNAPARALYDRAGFHTFAERRNYYRNDTTALCMKITLSAASGG